MSWFIMMMPLILQRRRRSAELNLWRTWSFTARPNQIYLPKFSISRMVAAVGEQWAWSSQWELVFFVTVVIFISWIIHRHGSHLRQSGRRSKSSERPPGTKSSSNLALNNLKKKMFKKQLAASAMAPFIGYPAVFSPQDAFRFEQEMTKAQLWGNRCSKYWRLQKCSWNPLAGYADAIRAWKTSTK